ncbi:putative lipase 8 precursor [Aspergillus saccharolyticus JOP 1030-1]|uniref:Putative lipase 8 n=1 Tax=Aspergillus saccharolyticus JOP 1030-1 TaxID=1450539 RepID=A0A318Z0I9_9EURO|nr:putative lipase 8 precursor [Aspergillus saccharolyticus JOP 1030-1]PYH40811.1 putative lipase 8 precursor [Aspergillus saccharolyticus JOP 1030-1]
MFPSAGAISQPRAFEIPLAPHRDSFYTPDDDGWLSQPPGSILKSRQVTIGSALTPPPGLASAHQLLYRTTDVHESPSYAVTTIMIPFGAKLDRFLVFLTGYDSVLNDCSPSYGLQLGASTNASESVVEMQVAMLYYIRKGIPLVVPDFLQHTAAFIVNPNAAYAVLDSMRAVLRSTHITGLSDTATIAMQGYSQGGAAAEWAGEFHRAYAPEVQIAGAAIGGLPTNISKAFLAAEKNIYAGIAAGMSAGLSNIFPAFAAYVDQHLLPEYKPLYEIVYKECIVDFYKPVYGFLSRLFLQNITSWYDNGQGIISDNLELLDEIGTAGLHGIPDFPMFMWKGTADEIAVNIEDHDALVQKYCDAGVSIQYLRIVKGLHGTSGLPGQPGAREFIMNVFEGDTPTECTTEDKFGLIET